MIFLPTHRSHLDYILIAFILFAYDLRTPLVAAGDNLLMPLFGFVVHTIQYNADLYSAVSRKRIGGAWRQCLDRLCASVTPYAEVKSSVFNKH